MHKCSTRLVFATIGIAVCCFSTSATVQSQSPTNLRCPAGYWPMESLCLNNSTGDVVEASPAAASRTALELGCAPGYWRLDTLCLSASTGDVELVDEKQWPAGQRAEAGK